MPNESQTQGLEHDLHDALEDLRTSLQRASDATAAIQRLVPRVTQLGSLFDEIAAVITTGREQLGIAGTPTTFSRPTLVAPSTPREQAPTLAPDKDPWAELSSTWNSGEGAQSTFDANASGPLVSFRLEFESRPGPLDLRAVDDAVSEHPAVRDVALLDYDGRKATLKVWIEGTATPADVHTSLVEKAVSLFGPENEVTVVALEDAA